VGVDEGHGGVGDAHHSNTKAVKEEEEKEEEEERETLMKWA
jgi:hypothetical protein